MDAEIKDRLLKLYTDPSSPGAFGGVSKLWRAAKDQGLKVTLAAVKSFLQAIPHYQRSRAVKRRFKRRKVMLSGIGDVVYGDVLHFTNKKWVYQNKRYGYLLGLIDGYVESTALPMKHTVWLILKRNALRCFEQVLKNASSHSAKGSQRWDNGSKARRALLDDGSSFATENSLHR